MTICAPLSSSAPATLGGAIFSSVPSRSIASIHSARKAPRKEKGALPPLVQTPPSRKSGGLPPPSQRPTNNYECEVHALPLLRLRTLKTAFCPVKQFHAAASINNGRILLNSCASAQFQSAMRCRNQVI